VASYSAGRDIAAELISEPSTGTNLDITATDQIRPIATTTAIIHASICIIGAGRFSHEILRPIQSYDTEHYFLD